MFEYSRLAKMQLIAHWINFGSYPCSSSTEGVTRKVSAELSTIFTTQIAFWVGTWCLKQSQGQSKKPNDKWEKITTSRTPNPILASNFYYWCELIFDIPPVQAGTIILPQQYRVGYHGQDLCGTRWHDRQLDKSRTRRSIFQQVLREEKTRRERDQGFDIITVSYSSLGTDLEFGWPITTESVS